MRRASAEHPARQPPARSCAFLRPGRAGGMPGSTGQGSTGFRPLARPVTRSPPRPVTRSLARRTVVVSRSRGPSRSSRPHLTWVSGRKGCVDAPAHHGVSPARGFRGHAVHGTAAHRGRLVRFSRTTCTRPGLGRPRADLERVSGRERGVDPPAHRGVSPAHGVLCPPPHPHRGHDPGDRAGTRSGVSTTPWCFARSRVRGERPPARPPPRPRPHPPAPPRTARTHPATVAPRPGAGIRSASGRLHATP